MMTSAFKTHEGVVKWKETNDGIRLQVANEPVSQDIFRERFYTEVRIGRAVTA